MKLKIFYIAIVLLGTTWCANAKSVRNGTITIDLNILKQQGDEVVLDMAVNVIPKAVDSRRSLTLVPVLKSATNRLEFPAIILNGKNKQKVIDRALDLNNFVPDNQTFAILGVSKRDPVSIQYRAAVPFESWMEDAHLDLEQNLCACDGYPQEFFQDLLASDVELIFVPNEINPAITIIVPEAEAVKNRNESGQAFLDFEVGRSVILPKFRTNQQELDKIHKMIEGVKNDPNSTISQIVIKGYASPEGAFKLNENLSKSRAEALSAYLKSHYGLNNIPIKVEWYGEDWSGLKEAIEASSSLANKQAILDIINSNESPDTKDQRLKKLSGGTVYKELLHTYYPPLRRSDYRIDYVVKAFTVEEGVVVLSTRPQQLSLNEMYLIANTYPAGSDAFNNVFDTAVLMFPEDAVANINAGAVAISKKDYRKAHRFLDKLKDHPEAWNNMGVLFMQEGNLEAAEAFFIKAKNKGHKDAIVNLEQLVLLRENMEKGVNQ